MFKMFEQLFRGGENQQLEALSSRLSTLENAVQRQSTDLQQVLDHVCPAKLEQLFRSGNNQQLEALSNRLSALENAVQRQSTNLQQILNSVSPPKLAPEREGRLTQLEDQVRDDNQWPGNARDAARFLEQASELVAELPPRAVPRYLPRLSRVRWAAMAFIRLNQATAISETPDRLDQLVRELRDLAEAKPEGGAEALVQALAKYAAEMADEASRRRVTAALEQANRYVEGAPGTAADVARLHKFFELYVADHETAGLNVNIPDLRQRLYKEMLRRQAVDQAAVLEDRWKTARKLEHHQPAVYETSARMLLQQAVSARVALVLEGVTTPIHDALERNLRDAVATVEVEAAERAERRQGRAVRSYQLWTLSEIKAFETELKRITETVDNAESWRDTVNPLRWDDPDYQEHREYTATGQYQEVRQAMINHLVPVNLALLDQPVQQRYQQAFFKGWQRLDGHDEQTAVATGSAVTEKKPLRDFLEDGS